jgi:hypothetical protein
MKYLGVGYDQDGTNSSHFEDVFRKTSQTAYYISRVTGRDSAPSVSVIIRLIRAILIPQLTYCFPLLQIDKVTLVKISKIIAIPLRKALGLGRHAHHARILWECGIPGVSTLLLQQSIAAANRAQRSLFSKLVTPSLLAQDIGAHNPLSYRVLKRFSFLPHRFRTLADAHLLHCLCCQA